MSVCVVASYPWRDVANLTGDRSRAVMMCSDTRVSVQTGEATYRPIPRYLAKQRGIASNIVVCYTSSDVLVTTAALDSVKGVHNLRSIGGALKKTHRKFGGLSEVVAVVRTHRNQMVSVLELMPPHYAPRPRDGVIGIGNRKVLLRFKVVFLEELSAYLEESGERLSLERARMLVFSAFTQALEEFGDATVALPAQLAMIDSSGIQRFQGMIKRAGSDQWESLTAPEEELTVPSDRPGLSPPPKEGERWTAFQIFD